MKKIFFAIALLTISFSISQAQQNRFNSELDKFCRTTIRDFKGIPKERKLILDGVAEQLARKKYVLFTCKTNSRRTVMLQVWAQTSFYYYGLYSKLAFSVGDTVTNVYSGVAAVLTESGFYCVKQENTAAKGYTISINKELPMNILSSKNEMGTIDTTKGIVVNICYADEQSNVAARAGHVNLPYESPSQFENTPQENQKYKELNQQIAAEMLYLGAKTKEIIEATEGFDY